MGYTLSPTTLNIFRECPRCFWLHINKGIKRPRGIFPSLPGGMDLVIKIYFDKYRLKGELPKEIRDTVEGRLFSDMKTLEKWRNWKLTDLRYEDKLFNVILKGALDDCIIEDKYYVPLDYKTKGSGAGIKENSGKYYQNQLDSYCLMLDACGYKTKGIAYLVYYWPKEVRDNGIVEFHVEPIKIQTNIESAKKIIKGAAILLSSAIPDFNPDCEYCNLVKTRKNEY